MSKVSLDRVPEKLYQMSLPFDYVYQIQNENNVPVGLIYLSDMDKDNIYIDWLEILIVFHGHGYLRAVFQELENIFSGKKIHLECSEELLKKYIRIGCVEHGISDCTENYILTYH